MSALAELAPPAKSHVVFEDIEPAQRFVLNGITWEQYEAIGDALPDRPQLRMTFDRGRLELMSKSSEHGRLAFLLGMLVGVLIEECDLVAGGFGEITLKEQLAERGLEPDVSFYAANFPLIRNKKRLDLSTDPPPDLAVEVDVTNSSIPRLPIYASLKVPEVWRWFGGSFRVYRLNAQGQYDESDLSTAFVPDFPVNEFVPFLEIGGSQGDAAMMRPFRTWVREWIADRGLTS